MGKLESFIIQERQNRILKNTIRMNELDSDINQIKSVLLEIKKMDKQYQDIEQQLKQLDEYYKNNKSKEVLYQKSNNIQVLSESIQNYEEKIKFTECLQLGSKTNKKIPMFLSGFKHFYKYKNEIELEENDKNIDFSTAVFSYLKQYRMFKKDKKSILHCNHVLETLIFKYELEKKKELSDIDKLTVELDERRVFLNTYSQNRLKLENELKTLSCKMLKLKGLFNDPSHKQKIEEYIKLRDENQIYQTQIDTLNGVDNKKVLVKCA